jgi:hypothetical protein
MATNIVEMIADEDECAFDQPCKFGHRVEGHAVYCHNDDWSDSPRKCRRTWYTGGEVRDEDCPGYQPNPEFKGTVSVPAVALPPCSQCGGRKLIKADRQKVETCPRCMGDGAEPSAVDMTSYEMNTLELGCNISSKNSHQYRHFIRIAETAEESEAIGKLVDMDLVRLDSMTGSESGAVAYLLQLTAKGDAVMHANWAARRDD